MTLPNDYARCKGVEKETQYGAAFRADCLTCERRLAGPSTSGYTVWTEPPKETPCPEYLEPRT